MHAMRNLSPLQALSLAGLALLTVVLAPSAAACNLREPTRQTGPGPHDFSSAPAERALWREGDAGEPLALRLRVIDTCGTPVEDALLRILHADQEGHHHADRWRAHLRSDARGEISLTTVFPGFTGGIPRHIHFIVTHPGHHDLETRLFFRNDPLLAGQGVDDIAMILEEFHGAGERRWIGGFEFVLAPRR
jgi:protocatechuate 3,4-dioxygenase beta subunit